MSTTNPQQIEQMEFQNRTVASSKSAGAPGFHGGHEDRSAEGAEGVEHWDWCPPPQPTTVYLGLGERRELPHWGPAANTFLAYLKPTEQPIESSIVPKRTSKI